MEWRFQSGCLIPADAEARQLVGRLQSGEIVNLVYADADPKKRTLTQNNSMWLFCELLAEKCNDAGLERKLYLEYLKNKEVNVPWNKNTVKTDIWDVIMEALTHKESSTEMKTTDPDKVYRVICRMMAEEFGLECPEWPTWRKK